VAVSTQVALAGELFGDVAIAETAPGLIAYRASAALRQFKWFDRTGREIGTLGAPDENQPTALRLSPDGRAVAFRRTLGGNTDLWSIDTSRGVLRRLTVDPSRDYDAIWAPGSDRLIFNSDRKGVLDLYEISLSGGGVPQATLVLESAEHKNTADWSADGRHVLYTVQSTKTGNDVWHLALGGDGTPAPLSQSAASELRARFSPDGRWVAFESNESGRVEVYVQTFPGGTRKTQVSIAGGAAASWRGDGRELYFRSLDDRLMAVRITPGTDQIAVEAPTALFALPPGPNRDGSNSSWYAPSGDGQRFLINTFIENATPITVVLIWKPVN
jgi:dipeptidyl aminopeptidase/acylaminoacyl peptidase